MGRSSSLPDEQRACRCSHTAYIVGVRSARSKSASMRTWSGFGAGSGTEGVEALTQLAVEFVWTHDRETNRLVSAALTCTGRQE